MNIPRWFWIALIAFVIGAIFPGPVVFVRSRIGA